jgi:hypothetical protein
VEEKMRNFNMLAVIAVAMLAGGVAVAAEKPAEAPKEKKICKGEAGSTSRIARRGYAAPRPNGPGCRTRKIWTTPRPGFAG